MYKINLNKRDAFQISPTDPKSRPSHDVGITDGQWPVHGQGENHVVPD